MTVDTMSSAGPAAGKARPREPGRPSGENRVRAFATDFDGTLAEHGVVPAEALAALARLRAAGIRVLMVTGRELEDLARIFPELDRFDVIVAENGALLYFPREQYGQMLVDPPPAAFVNELMARGVGPISVGHGIVATWEPHQSTILEVVRDLGLEFQIIFNKGAVMILPAGVNKASGLEAALAYLHLAPAGVVAVGDAENDHAMLEMCRYPVAVANALPAVKERARYVTHGARGAGVVELIDRLLAPGFVLP